MRRLVGIVYALAMAGCTDCDSPQPPERAVDTSIYGATLGEAMLGASASERETFARGKAVALRRFDTQTGLGPQFNVSFCGACHEQPVTGGASPRYRDFLLVGNRLDDGSYIALGNNGVLSQFSTEAPYREPTPAQANAFTKRSAIPFFGVGAIAALDDAAILANADEEDANDDGISGRPNYDRGFVGRFGRKAQTVSIEGFIRGPLFNHMGITSNPLSEALKAELPVPSATLATRGSALFPCITCQAAAPDEPTVDGDDVPDPELAEQDLFDLVSFAMLMGAPAPDEPTSQTQRGRVLFDESQCAACHVPTLRGPGGDVALYSDLLLHDMGDGLADNVEMGVATGHEFRTQPLWGVAAVGPYMHDGRANTLDEAIRMHEGESEKSRKNYEALSEADQADLIAFMMSLGGASVRSAGLLLPDTPVPAVGEWGGPKTSLVGEDVDLYMSGRAEFDRNIVQETGLGQSGRFNGDSCRACHFEPVIGGAGPVGVNVTRQGIVNDGVYTQPGLGTMVHRFSVDDRRPTTDAMANVIELRQTPPIFGLGLVEQIDGQTIRDLEDPDDLDQDGISGRAHILADGRVGRFGWKASLPTLEDFVRDALSNEIGLTLPMDPNFVAGLTMDDDAAEDPEFEGPAYDAMVFFNKNLGPPPRGEVGDVERRGEAVFSEVQCAACHVSQLLTPIGQDVALYSDLLLHDVAPEGYRGIADGQATTREFRTPLLWGLRATAPYMHDGLSPTLEHAVLRHKAEAAQSTTAYKALIEEDRLALLAFLRSL